MPPQEGELSSAVYIIDEATVSPGTAGEREVFVVKIPEGMNLEEERALYEQCAGQVRTFGAQVDLDVVSYQQ